MLAFNLFVESIPSQGRIVKGWHLQADQILEFSTLADGQDIFLKVNDVLYAISIGHAITMFSES